ncbi:MFS transporter [Streptomyces sp. NPDC048483]|uniref:MFS transporter n=1 Tax=Streptomyces sp. NPDC048483 TaxID=3154927 RepID=UPI0034325397
MVPQVLATLHVTFAEGSRAKAFGLYGAVMSVGGVAGPVLGGVLTQADLFGLGWRPIFLINLPIGLCTILLGRRFSPSPEPTAPCARTPSAWRSPCPLCAPHASPAVGPC